MPEAFDITTATQEYLDGSISPDDLARLDEALRTSDEAAEQFARATRVNDALRSHFEARESRRLATGELRHVARSAVSRRASKSRLVQLAAMAAAAVVVIAVGVALLASDDGSVVVASTTGLVEAHRGGAVRPIGASDVVHPGTTIVVPGGGGAELRYGDGTTLSLAGGVRLEFVPSTAKRVRLRGGRVTADVARQLEGRPMTLASEHVTVTVLGTRLSLDAARDVTEVWVDRGRVHVERASDGRSADLKGGQGAVVARDDRDEIVVRPAGELAGGLHRGLALYWPMDEGEGETVSCAAGSGMDGRLPGAQWVNGVRGTALHLDGDEFFESRAEVNLGANASIACWVRREGQGTLVCNNGLHATPHHASTKDMLFLGLEQDRLKGGTDISSVWPSLAAHGRTPLRSGYWHHAVFVMRDGVHLSLYLDGKLDATVTIETNAPFNGHVIVGWSGASWTHQSFRGDIDDVRIYERALGADEVRALFEVR